MTDNQRTASRANGAKSTGPASPEGKARSSQNSLKSGLYAKSQIVRGEDPAELEALLQSYRERFHPTTPEVSALIDTLVSSEWLLRRLRRIESQFWDITMRDAWRPDAEFPLAQAFALGHEQFALLQRRLDSADRTYRRTLELLLKLEKRTAQPTDSKPLTASPGSFPQSLETTPEPASNVPPEPRVSAPPRPNEVL